MSRRRKERTPEGPRERIQLQLTGMGHQGMALARHGDQAVLVAYGIPGEVVEVEITRRHKDYLEGEVVRVLEPSPHRREPPCRYYGVCGGCQLQHVAYEHQLELKAGVVAEQLRRIGKFPDPPVAPTLGAPSPWHYRNHARFTINKEGRVGFVRRESHRLVPIETCLLLEPWINRTLAELQGHCSETRQLSVRYGANTGESIIQPRIKNPSLALETGQSSYTEELIGHRFRVASPAFFQVNTAQAERLVEVVRSFLCGRELALLVDAYAGVGTFAVLLAPLAARVVAVEESPPAVRDGRYNAQTLANVEFIQGKVEEVLPGLDTRPDAVLLDPPRAGCHHQVLQALAAQRPAQVVYVSCDPATLARDLRVLCDGGFQLQRVQPVDMFPQTYHIECVALLHSAGG